MRTTCCCMEISAWQSMLLASRARESKNFIGLESGVVVVRGLMIEPVTQANAVIGLSAFTCCSGFVPGSVGRRRGIFASGSFRRSVCVNGIGEDACEHDDVFTFFEDTLIDVVGKNSADPGVFEAVSGVEVSV